MPATISQEKLITPLPDRLCAVEAFTGLPQRGQFILVCQGEHRFEARDRRGLIGYVDSVAFDAWLDRVDVRAWLMLQGIELGQDGHSAEHALVLDWESGSTVAMDVKSARALVKSTAEQSQANGSKTHCEGGRS